jgi:hypothetical protein
MTAPGQNLVNEIDPDAEGKMRPTPPSFSAAEGINVVIAAP